MKTFVAAAVSAVALCGCVTAGPVTEGLTLSVRAYDPASGQYELELRNNSSRPALYLHPYFIFSTELRRDAEPFPLSPEGTLMVHDTKLAPGKSVTFTGRCSSQGHCAGQRTHVAVLACWFTEEFTCQRYLRVWSATPLNGA